MRFQGIEKAQVLRIIQCDLVSHANEQEHSLSDGRRDGGRAASVCNANHHMGQAIQAVGSVTCHYTRYAQGRRVAVDDAEKQSIGSDKQEEESYKDQRYV